MIEVLLVDDHELVRLGIKSLLDQVEGVKVIGEVDSGEEALAFAKKNSVDVVLLDVMLPGISGLETTERLQRSSPETKIIVLSAHYEDPLPTQLFRAGASGYLTKGTGIKEMMRAIYDVCDDKRYIDPEVAQSMALKNVDEKTPGEVSPFESLSKREVQVMMMITRGVRVQDIADKLHLSAKTINSYRYRIFEKLNVQNDVELTHLALRHGLIEQQTVQQGDQASGL